MSLNARARSRHRGMTVLSLARADGSEGRERQHGRAEKGQGHQEQRAGARNPRCAMIMRQKAGRSMEREQPQTCRGHRNKTTGMNVHSGVFSNGRGAEGGGGGAQQRGRHAVGYENRRRGGVSSRGVDAGRWHRTTTAGRRADAGLPLPSWTAIAIQAMRRGRSRHGPAEQRRVPIH